jgi:hypothetical protein
MPLAHFTAVDSHREKWEPIHPNLFEVTIILPQVLQSIHPNATHLLLENTVEAGMPTYPTLTTAEQRFKYSTRLFVMMPESTSIKDLKIKFNLNQNDDYQIFCFKMLKDWYDLAWNNETGTLHYKKNLVGDIIIHQHDKEGKVIRRVTYHNAMMLAFSGMETLNWGSGTEVMSLDTTFAADYFEDFYY